MPFSVGEHVQFRFRSGTRAGFVRKRLYSPGDAEKENVAVGKSAVEHASRTKPVYIIEIEKNGDLYAKTQDQISRVGGEEGLSEEEIVDKDRRVKCKKVSGHKTAAAAEPKKNARAKSALMRGKKPRRAK
eukprot:Phypoly_transcript_21423.p2 GENE.Phypoly_transcript_21423~~Phypoly_transcript_21423.p2  ORF type:complete len:130 (+),score=31.47 Phypoly_transcript_21423:106-495(+)